MNQDAIWAEQRPQEDRCGVNFVQKDYMAIRSLNNKSKFRHLHCNFNTQLNSPV